MEIQLTDAIWENTQGFFALPSISKDGRFAYFVYQINADGVDTKAVELFAINSGKFVSLATFNILPGDVFFSSLSGFANDDFTQFTFLRTNLEDGAAGLYRLDTLRYDGTPNLQIISTVVKSAHVTGYTPFGANYVSNGKYIVVTAVVEDYPTYQVSAMWLFDANLTVKQILTYQEVFTTETHAFTQCSRDYFIIASAGGKLDFTDPESVWKPPFSLNVFEVSNGLIYRVTGISIPQGSFSCNVYEDPCGALISVGTFLALAQNDVAIPKATEFNQSATPDESELRIYRFLGNALQLQKTYDYDSTVDSVFINKQLMIHSVNAGPYVENASSFFTIQSRTTCAPNFSRPVNDSPFFVSSEDGSVLLVGSSSRPDYNNNLLLYSVRS